MNGAMTHAWFDVTAGVAGDMVLGALLDAGADAAGVQAALDALVPGAVRLEVEKVRRAGQRATHARVRVLVDDPPHRTWASTRADLRAAPLAGETRRRALAVFGLLAEAEARAHGIEPDEVHFHEVGALDSIADVVGSCEALRLLGVETVSATPVALGSGRVRAAHGDLPVPVPAVAELARGWTVLGTHGGPVAHRVRDEAVSPEAPDHEHTHGHAHDEPAEVITPGEVGELATPTGMALVRGLAASCEPLPLLTVEALGVGAGSRDLVGRPNVVRVMVGEPGAPARAPHRDDALPAMAELAANVDDLDPRVWPGVLAACLRAGAADAWLVPIHMKKGRPAFTLHALTAPEFADDVARVMLTHTTTLGVREVVTHRHVLDRSFVDLDLEGHPLVVKVGSRDGFVVHAAAEFGSLAALAHQTGRPEAEFAQLAAHAIVAAGLVPGARLESSGT